MVSGTPKEVSPKDGKLLLFPTEKECLPIITFEEINKALKSIGFKHNSELGEIWRFIKDGLANLDPIEIKLGRWNDDKVKLRISDGKPRVIDVVYGEGKTSSLQECGKDVNKEQWQDHIKDLGKTIDRMAKLTEYHEVKNLEDLERKLKEPLIKYTIRKATEKVGDMIGFLFDNLGTEPILEKPLFINRRKK